MDECEWWNIDLETISQVNVFFNTHKYFVKISKKDLMKWFIWMTKLHIF